MKTINELLSDPETAKAVYAFADSQVTKALKTYSSKRLDTSTLTARLLRLEAALQQKEKEQDMKFHIFKKCYEAGVNYDLVKDIPFSSKEEAEKKILQLQEFAAAKAEKTFNERIIAETLKPGTGGSNPADKLAKYLSAEELLAVRSNKR
jgi:hypothetical protein